MQIISPKHIKAEEGMDLIRTFDSMNFGSEAFLGKSLRDGVLVDDKPEDFHEEKHEEEGGGDEPMNNEI